MACNLTNGHCALDGVVENDPRVKMTWEQHNALEAEYEALKAMPRRTAEENEHMFALEVFSKDAPLYP